MVLSRLAVGGLVASIALGWLAFDASAQETVNPAQYEWTEQFAGTPLDLKGYTLTFSDDFNKASVTADSGAGPWFAPGHADFGTATFDAPGSPNLTYVTNGGVLTMRAVQTADGKWHGGSVQTVDAKGKGFAQQYGYFEARLKFPLMPGAWCSFWLKSQAEYWDMKMIRSEIDTIEYYGGDPTGHHRTVHLWPARSPEFQTAGRQNEHWYASNFSRHAMVNEWHTYGTLVTPELVIVYMDRKEVGRFPTLEEFRTPLYMLISLTLYEKDTAKAVSPIPMGIDYVRVYNTRVPNPPKLNGVAAMTSPTEGDSARAAH